MKKDKVLVLGSIAYDRLMLFEGKFQDELISSKLNALSVSFGVTEKASFLGGCGGNISRHLKKLGTEPLLIGIVGHDFGDYESRLRKEKINTRFLVRIPEKHTASASIVTDDEDRQIAFFNFGAQGNYKNHHFRHLRKLLDREKISFAILSPTNTELIMRMADYCSSRNVPYFFDPGQAIPQFEKIALQKLIRNAFGVLVNEYEMALLEKKHIKISCELVCKTLGEKGSLITFQGKTLKIAPVPVKMRFDPTGAGDAYRAGFLHSLAQTGKAFSSLSPEDIKRAGVAGSKFASQFLSQKKI